MGFAEKAMLASLKAQLETLKAQVGTPGLDDETRALVAANRDYLQAQVDVLEAGGSAADLANVPHPAGGGAEAPAYPAAADSAAGDAVVSVGGSPAPGSEPISATPRSWLGKAALALVVVVAVAIALVWTFGGLLGLGDGFPGTGCDIWTSSDGWTHYDAGDPACEDAGD